VTVTIPAASDIVAVMTWLYQDGGGGGAPTVPGGATATSRGTAPFREAGTSYPVTVLSAGSATFTPPSSGGNQACLVAVFGDADSTGDTDYSGFEIENPVTRTVDTPGTGDYVLLVLAAPSDAVTATASGGSTLVGESATSSYGGTMAAVYRARSGATTDIAAGYDALSAPAYWTVAISEAAGGGGSITFDEDYQISLPVLSGW